ncbi:hypothetical protein [Glycomyces arizonensis]|uniref:hypothetical protein n=1 Tax=Glycomyces arizonensis TaxID=256035 RepID=UPI000422E165|nr:hypothetical protein [Glycomyces arizonensis]
MSLLGVLCCLSPVLIAVGILLKLGADAVDRVPLAARKISGRIAFASSMMFAFGYATALFMNLDPFFPDDYCLMHGGQEGFDNGRFRGEAESPLLLTNTIQCGSKIHHYIPLWVPFVLAALLAVATIAAELYFTCRRRDELRRLKAQ